MLRRSLTARLPSSAKLRLGSGCARGWRVPASSSELRAGWSKRCVTICVVRAGFRRTAPVVLIAASLAAVAAPRAASAGFFDFLFNNQNGLSAGDQPHANAYGAGATASNRCRRSRPTAVAAVVIYAHCVRMCDGRYFPILARSGTPPAQLCQSFCPASATRVFFGSSIDSAMAANGERYAETPNAYVYRKQLSPELHLQRPRSHGPRADRRLARHHAAPRRRGCDLDRPRRL